MACSKACHLHQLHSYQDYNISNIPVLFYNQLKTNTNNDLSLLYDYHKYYVPILVSEYCIPNSISYRVVTLIAANVIIINVVWPAGAVALLQQHGHGHSRLILTQVWKQTSGDPSGQTLNYDGIMLPYNFTTALLYKVSSVTMARIMGRLLNIY